ALPAAGASAPGRADPRPAAGAAGLRRRLTPRHLAYVKIAEGCDHACSFCAIPGIRGRLQSRPHVEIVAEVRGLAADGVREIAVVAQDTTGYGRDRGEPGALVRLLEDLLTVPALRRIRLHYLYPSRISRDLIGLLAREPRLCRYLDMPLQHSDAAVLRAMGRGGNAASLTRLVKSLRAAVPGLVLRTAFITGFPGETRPAFEGLRRFVEQMRFDRVGVFCYSDEEGTQASALGPKVARRVAEARRASLMAIQARIAEAQGQALVGTIQEVMVDGPAVDFPDLQSGRLPGQAFEVDGQVYLSRPAFAPGTLVRARIREALEHDLVGEVVEVAE
ncbi:MAG TPA: MiaB/RimO family radical SAM methylthiotransferase, partial [Candidatus Sulfotelmatobacter sp.]|nr:MiaB/RimO family radical SAM methylthiotransferase [Candidatus Sulfotelmatobacter sp.]